MAQESAKGDIIFLIIILLSVLLTLSIFEYFERENERVKMYGEDSRQKMDDYCIQQGYMGVKRIGIFMGDELQPGYFECCGTYINEPPWYNHYYSRYACKIYPANVTQEGVGECKNK